MGKNKDNACGQVKCDQKQIGSEVKTRNYLKENVDQFSSPTTRKWEFFNMFDYMVISIICMSYMVYMLTYFDTISWQLASIGRIVMINTIPFYDWRHLKNKYCLIEKTGSAASRHYDCGLCENIRKIDVYKNLDEDYLDENYINLDTPVILTDALAMWPKDSEFIQRLKEVDEFAYSYPCKLSTNVIKHFNDIGEVLTKPPHFDEFYLHFQNCELEPMRALRKYTFRPAAIPVSHSPTLYNWVIWNRNYNTSNFKPVELVEKLSLIGQLFGVTYIRLVPRFNCVDVCPTLEVKLFSGEMLVFTDLWDLEYRPNETGENMAVILEYCM